MKPLDTIIKAIKTGDFVSANEAFGNIMQQKVSVLIANERRDVGKRLTEAKEANKCELCGSKEKVKRVDDTWICSDCDIEESDDKNDDKDAVNESEHTCHIPGNDPDACKACKGN